MLHLLVASFRALPLDLMVPVSRRGFVWGFFSRDLFFFLSLFLLLFCFVFFSLCVSFFLGVFSISRNALSLQHCQSGHLRTCAQHSAGAASARKGKGGKKEREKKVWDDLSLLMWGWSWVVYISGFFLCVAFLLKDYEVTKRERGGALQKKKPILPQILSDVAVLWNKWGNHLLPAQCVTSLNKRVTK